jgi:cyclic pyranopterin phosphate synthase
VTDRCNERCIYCLPEGYHGWQPRAEHLTDDELVAIAQVAGQLGFRKFRLTGGEPLVRPGLPDVARRIWDLPGVETLGISTNGTRLAKLAVPLREAGVRTTNVSLDSLDAERYRRITGGSLEAVIEGLEAAKSAGFECIKLNCVLMRGVNEDDLWPLAQFAGSHGFPLRLIELMPLTRTEVLTDANFLPVQEARRILEQHDRLIPAPDARLGYGPARYFRFERGGGIVGFIGALTQECFCDRCNKLRLTADGKLRPCLGQHLEVDLIPSLRPAIDVTRLRDLFLQTIADKPREHLFRDVYQPERPMTAIGG